MSWCQSFLQYDFNVNDSITKNLSNTTDSNELIIESLDNIPKINWKII